LVELFQLVMTERTESITAARWLVP
jgi:hypothetical protein